MKYLWPIKTGITFFDYWTLAHFTFWFFIGSTLAAFKLDKLWSIVVCVLFALGWEVFERFAEHKWQHIWLSPESWVNAWISDIVMCVLGVWIAMYGYENWRV